MEENGAVAIICEPELSVTPRKHLHGDLEGGGTGAAAGWQSRSPCGCHLDFPAEETPWEWLPGGLEGLKGLRQTLPS